MKIVSLCTFNVATVLWEARAAEWTLTVVVKATFALKHGLEATIAEEQEPVGDDRYWDDDPSASVHTPSDFVPFKPRADIVLVGHAYAPKGAPATVLDARLRVGEFSKAVRVIGDRGWVRAGGGWMPGPSMPFTRMPLRYERASIGTDNPVGIDPKALASTGAPALPNLDALSDGGPRALSYDGISPRQTELRAQSPCFGPLASTWRARRGLVSDQAFLWALGFRGDRRLTTSAAPAGFDFGFFNAAPRDQQVDLLRVGATIVLENMSPEHAWFETRLPGVRPKVFLPDATTGRPREVALRADTLWIDTDRSLATVAWRGLTSVAGMVDDDSTRMVVVAESKGQPTRMAVIDRLLREGSSRDSMTDEQEDEANLLNQRHDAVKPHRPSTNMRFAQLGTAGEPGDEPFDRTPTERVRHADQDQDPEPVWANEAEPPTEAIQSEPEPTRPAPSSREATQEFVVPTLPRGAPLPFLRPTLVSAKGWGLPGGGAESAPAPSDAPTDDRKSAEHTAEILAPAMRQAATPFEEAPDSAPGTVPLYGPESTSDFAETAPMADTLPPDLLGEKMASLPDADGDPGSQEVDSMDTPTPPPFLRPSSAGQAPVTPAAADSASQTQSGDVTVEHYAQICAELAERPTERAAILVAHGFPDALWRDVDSRWRAAIAKEAEGGQSQVLTRYDTAYIAAQERFRDPIGVAEYAEILLGVERGEVGLVLGQLKLRLSDLMRLQRVWTKKLAADAQLASELAATLAAARTRRV